MHFTRNYYFPVSRARAEAASSLVVAPFFGYHNKAIWTNNHEVQKAALLKKR